MPLTVLSDSDVRDLLLQLTKQDILDLQQSLADALHYYSTSTEDDYNGCCASYQPLRTALKRSDGQKTLFMPASSNDGIGVKIVTLAGSNENKSSDAESATSSLRNLSISDQSNVSVSTSSTAFTPPASLASGQSTTPKGSLTLFDRNGNPRALINAEEITAFRTALASTMFFKKRHNVHDIVVFGGGKQAYWHIRLALLLRGEDIHHLNIINRSFDRVHQLLEKLYKPHSEPPEWAKMNQVAMYRTDTNPVADLPRPKIQILTPSHAEYDRLLKSTIRSSSVIFCTTPSVEPLFPASFLTNPEGRKKGRYIAAIGSYTPHMIEVHPDILRQNVAPEHGHRHFHKHAQRGAVVVDSVEACFKEAGEVIQAGLKADEVVEIGELLMLKRDAMRRRQESANNRSEEGLDERGVELGECEKSKKKRRGSKKEDMETEDKAHKSLLEWLRKGNVIYKSVGLGLMDVVVGGDLVRLADERGIGTKIENF